MILRLSQKLCSEVKVGVLSTLPQDENPFADWSAHLFVANRAQHIILSNTNSLYSTVMYAKGITNDSQFIECALSRIREFMKDDGQEYAYHRFIAPASESISFAKALNRSVTSSMNELVRIAMAMLVADDLSPHQIGFKLNDVLLSSLARNKSQKYGKPRDAFKDLANSNEAR